MPVIGIGTFSPSPVFNVPRQYLYNFATHTQWTLESHVDNVFVFNDFTLYNDRIFITLRESLWPWTSNSYQLETMVIECYYHALPSTTPLPLNFTLRWLPSDASHQATVRLTHAAFSASYQYFPLPPVDEPYWQ